MKVKVKVLMWLCMCMMAITRAEAVNGQAQESLYLGMAAEADGNFQTAIQHLQYAAQKGEAKAYLELGNIYSSGPHKALDYAKAKTAFEQAASKGYAGGWYGLGDMYANGKGMDKNDKLAVFYYIKAAQAFHAQASFYLGSIYAKGGQGVAQNMVLSRTYYEQACLGGWQQGCSKLKSK